MSTPAPLDHEPTPLAFDVPRLGRVCGGPISGPNVASRLSLSPVSSHDSISELFGAVLSADPHYLPGVSSGSVSFSSWYARKSPAWVRTARTPVADPLLAGHIAARLNGCLPDGRMLEDAGGPRLSWELGMLVVRPGLRGCGIATALIDEAAVTFDCPLWASVHVDGPGHALLKRAGWLSWVEFFWPGDPRPGIVMTSR